jgi:hypothetical protein
VLEFEGLHSEEPQWVGCAVLDKAIRKKEDEIDGTCSTHETYECMYEILVRIFYWKKPAGRLSRGWENDVTQCEDFDWILVAYK